MRKIIFVVMYFLFLFLGMYFTRRPLLRTDAIEDVDFRNLMIFNSISAIVTLILTISLIIVSAKIIKALPSTPSLLDFSAVKYYLIALVTGISAGLFVIYCTGILALIDWKELLGEGL